MKRLFLFKTLFLLFFICQGQVSKTNSTTGTVTNTPASGAHLDRTFTFSAADFSGCTSLTEVDISIQLILGNGTPPTLGGYGVHEDLNVRLYSPTGTYVDLVQDRWGYLTGNPTQTNSYSGFTAVNGTVHFDDDHPIQVSPTNPSANEWMTGNFAPHNPLNAFDNENAVGTWTLRISDGNNQFAATDYIHFVTATLNITCAPACTDPDIPTLTYSPGTICDGNSALITISGNLNDATGWNVYTGSCGGTLVTSTAGSTVIVTPTSPSTTYFIRGEGGCVTPGSCETITINTTAREDASFSYSSSSYCQNESDPSPTITGAGGGTFTSAPGGLSINSTSGQIDVSASTPNTYTVTYDTPGLCFGSESVSVTINALDDPSFSYSAASYCTGDADPTPTITGIPTGTFSAGAGLSINTTTGQIDVSTSTPGTYTVTYTTAGTCPNSSSVSVTINALDDPSFSYSAASYCTADSDPTPTITGASGGTFSASPTGLSINTTTGQIDVSTSTPGTYTVTYATAGTCPNSSSVSVTINALDDPSFSYSAASYCASDSDPTPTITGASGGTFSASPTGLSINTSTGQIDLSASTNNTYTVTYTTSSICANSSSVSVTITGGTVAVCQNIDVYLDGTGNATITASDIDGGSTGCGTPNLSASQTAFTCADIGPNNVSFTVDDGNGNTANCSAVVTVSDTISPTASCQNINIYLDGAGNASIVASDIDGGSTDNCGAVTLSASLTSFTCAHIGSNNVTLTVDDGNGNTDDCIAVVTVLDTISPTITCSDTTIYLDYSGNVTLSLSSTTISTTTDTVDFDDMSATNAFATQTTPTNDYSDGFVTFSSSGDWKVLDFVGGGFGVTGLSNPNFLAYNTNVTGSTEEIMFATVVENVSFKAASSAGTTLTAIAYDESNLILETIVITLTSAAQTITFNYTNILRIEISASGGHGGIDDIIYTRTINDYDNCSPVTLSASQTAFTCSDVGPNNIIFTADDGNGNSSNCIAVVTVLDTISPTITCSDTTIYLDNSGNVTLNLSPFTPIITTDTVDFDDMSASNAFATQTTPTNDYSDGIVTFSSSGDWKVLDIVGGGFGVTGLSNPNFLAYNTAVTGSTEEIMFATVVENVSFKAVSSAGATLTAIAYDESNLMLETIVITLTSAAQTITFNYTNILRIEISASGGHGGIDDIIYTRTINDYDNCSPVTLSASQTAFTCADIGPNNVSFTVDDGNGNTANCSAVVTVSDTISPVITCSSDTIVSADSSTCSATITLPQPTVIDNCDTFTSCPADITDAGSTIGGATWDRTICGSTTLSGLGPVTYSTFMFTISADGDYNISSVQDYDGYIHLYETSFNPLDQLTNLIECNDDGLGSIGTSDIVDITLSAGTDYILVTSGFEAGDEGNFTTTISSTCGARLANTIETQPYEGYLGNTEIEAAKAAWLLDNDVRFTDIQTGINLRGIISLVNDFNNTDDASGVYPVGVTTVTWTATDSSGNSATCSQTVTVEDNEAPTAVCQDVTVYLDGSGNASILTADIDGGSTDNCGAVTLLASQATFTCSDASIIPIPTDLFISEYIEGSSFNKALEITNNTGAAIDLTAGGYMLALHSNGSPVASQSMALTGTLADGDVLVLAHPQANAAIQAQADFTSTQVINFNGNDAVVLSNSAGIIDIFGTTGENPGTEWSVSGNNTANQTLIRNLNVTQGQTSNAAGFPSLGTEWIEFPQDDISNLGSHSIDLGTVAVELTVTDLSGNMSTCNANVLVLDTISPTASCQNITVFLDGSGNATIVAADIDNGSSDNCGAVILSASQTAFTCADAGPNNVTLTATDSSGNTANCAAVVTVSDTISPTASCQNITVYLDGSGNATIVAADIDGGSTDNCGAVTLSASQTAFTTADLGPNNVTLTVSDASGNTATCIAVVTVEGAPTAICQDFTAYLDASGNVSIAASDVDGGSTAPGGIDFIAVSPNSFTCATVGDNQVVLTVTSNSGLTDTCHATVTVLDTISPTAICQNIDVYLDENGVVNVAASEVDNGSTDNCSLDNLSLDISSFDCSNIGENTVTLTVTDSSGNTATCTSTVTVLDTITPMITCSDITVDTDPGICEAFITVESPRIRDNCFGNLIIADTSLNNTPAGAIPDGDVFNPLCDVISITGAPTEAAVIGVTVDVDVSHTWVGDVSISLESPDGTVLTLMSRPGIADSTSCCGCGDNDFTINFDDTAIFSATDLENYCSGANATPWYNGAAVPLDALGDLIGEAVNGNWTLCVSDAEGLDLGTLNSWSINIDYEYPGGRVSALSQTSDLKTQRTIEFDLSQYASKSAEDKTNAISLASTFRGDTGFTFVNDYNGTDDASGVYPIGSTVVVWTVTDSTGNSATCEQTITVEDNEAPIAVCQDITVYLDENGVANITASEVDNGTSDNCALDSISIDISSFDCSHVGGNTVTLTAVDSSGNSSTCTSTVTVLDSIAPIITCASDTTVDAELGVCEAFVMVESPEVMDNCVGNIINTDTSISNAPAGAIPDGDETNPLCDVISITEAPTGATITGVTVDVDVSHTWVGDLSISLESPDGTILSLMSRPGVPAGTFGCGDNDFIITFDDAALFTATDLENNCSGATPWYNGTAGSIDALGDLIGEVVNGNWTLCISDAVGLDLGTLNSWSINIDYEYIFGGRVSSLYQTSDLKTQRAIEIDLSQYASRSVEEKANASNFASTLRAGGYTLVNDYNGTDDASDTYPVGSTTVIWTATDSFGNSATCEQIITVEDNEAPVAVCQDITVYLDASGSVSITGADIDGGSSDNCSITSLDASQTAFICSGVGPNDVTLTVTDGSGNTAQCVAVVTVLDTISPMITCPADTVVSTDPDVCTAAVTLPQPFASDNCGADIGGRLSGISIATFDPLYTRTENKSNNASSGFSMNSNFDESQTITFNNNTSTQRVAEVLSQSNDYSIDGGSVSCNAGSLHADNSYLRIYDLPTLGYTDGFDVSEVSFGVQAASSTSGSQPLVINVYAYNTADAFVFSNLTLQSSVSFNLSDISVAIVNQAISAHIPAGMAMVVELFTPDGQTDGNIFFIGSNDLGETGDSYIAAAECGITEPITFADIGFPDVQIILDVIGEATVPTFITLVNDYNGTDDASGTYPIGSTTVTWTATDESGNSSTCSHVVTVEDNEIPEITCPGNQTENVDANCEFTLLDYTSLATASDNCGTATVTQSPIAGTVVSTNTTITLTADDGNGNTNTCTFNVILNDATPPVAVCQDISVYLDGSGNATIVAADIDGGSTDNCGTITLDASQTAFTCAEVGLNNVTLTVTDDNSNTASCVAVVTVIDTISPTAVCQDITVYLAADGSVSISAADVDGGSSDACGIDSISIDIDSFSCATTGPNTVTLTVVDNNGNSSSCVATVTVLDTISPVVSCNDLTAYLDANGNVSISASDLIDNDNLVTIDILTDNFASETSLEITDINGTVIWGIAQGSLSSATQYSFDALLPCGDFTFTIYDSFGDGICCDWGIGDYSISVGETNIFSGSSFGSSESTPFSIATCTSADNCVIDDFTISQSDFDCSNVGDNSVTVTVTDQSGNSTSCISTVTILDTISPVIVCLDDTVYLDMNGEATIDANDLNTGVSTLEINILTDNFAEETSFELTDSDGGVLLSDSYSASVDDNTLFTYAIALSCGNDFDFTIYDEFADGICCAWGLGEYSLVLDGVTIFAGGAFGASETTTISVAPCNASDACGIDSISADITTFNCDDIGDNPVVITAVDVNGNSSSCTSNITVLDTISPTLICQDITVYLDDNGSVTITPSDVDGGSSDNCDFDLSIDIDEFDCSNIGPNNVTLSGADGSSNADSCVAVVTVLDTISPTAVCQNITIYLDGSGNATIVASDIDGGSADNCSAVTLTASPTSFTCAEVGPNDVILTVTDGSSNTANCIAVVTVLDTIAPTAVCQNISVYLDGSGNATIVAADIDGGSTDNCGTITLDASQTAFTCADVGANDVTLTVTDESSNTASCVAVVTVIDSISPTAVCQDITVYLDDNGDVSITPSDVDGGSSDNCDFDLSIDIDAFDCSTLGANTVVLTALDVNGNSASCNATVTVVDSIAPIFTNCFNDTTVIANTLECGYIYDFVIEVEDNCPAGLTVTSNYEIGDVLPFGTTTIIYTATDASGNSSSCIFEVTVDTDLDIVIDEIVDVSCNGGNDGAINVTTIGGTAPYTYRWSNDIHTEDIGGLVAGDYILFIVDANGCTFTSDPITVGEPTPIVESAPAVIGNATCDEASNGSIDITISGGTPPYTYLWTNGSTDEDPTNFEAGSHQATVTDANGCVFLSPTYIVDEATTIAVSVASITFVDCNGEATGAIDINVFGGTPPYTFEWSDASTDEDLSNAPAGDYSVTITDMNGCTYVSDTYSIIENDAIEISASTVTDANCNGESSGAINISVVGGTAPYSYLWSNGATTQDISGIGIGFYSVTITDNLGCTFDSETYTIEEPTILEAGAPIINDIICNGASSGTISFNPTGGTPPYTYVWNDGSTDQMNTGLFAGDYSVTIYDVNGCSVQGTGTISEEDAITITSTSVTNVLCSSTGDGAIDIEVEGGNPPYSYEWSNGATTEDLTDISGGTYTVTITDDNNCFIVSAEIEVSESSPFMEVEDPIIVDVTCNGGSDGSIAVFVIGGTAPYTYDWDNGASTDEILVDAMAGVHTLTITDDNGCTFVSSYEIEEPDAIEVVAIIKDAACFQTSSGAIDITVTGGTAPYDYEWSDGSPFMNLSDAPAGDYTVIITDDNGCTFTSEVLTIEELNTSAVEVTFDITNASGNGIADGSITATATGGSGSFTYEWQNGWGSSPTLSAVTNGTYCIEVTDLNGCVTIACETVDIITGVADITLVNNITLYPNPTSDFATLEILLSKKSNVQIDLVDILGRSIKHLEPIEGSQIETQFDVRLLPSGTYFVNLSIDNERVSLPLIITH